MRIFAGVACSMLLITSFVFAQDDGYSKKAAEILEASSGLNTFLNAGKIDFEEFDKWFKAFQETSGEFRKDFVNIHKSQDSFKSMQEALDNLSAAWNAFYQAKYSQTQYQESITLDKVDDAHKWRNAEIDQRKKAVEYLIIAMERFVLCRKALDKGQ